MLVAQGHKVLHSTRHRPLELGKDVVSVAPDGVPCAYQLKGHPRGRLTLNDYRGIAPQLDDLTNLAIPFREFDGVQHRSYLVTNGLVEEDTRIAIEQRNQAQTNAGYPGRHLYVLDRGELLHMAQDLGYSLWPTEIEETHTLLELLVDRGTGPYPAKKAQGMLGQLLGLRGPRPKWGAPEVKRRVTSAAILTSVSLQEFTARENHWAIASAWVQFACAAIAACDRFEISFDRNARAAVDLAAAAIEDALIDLAQEALSRGDLVEGDALTDAAFVRARRTLVVSAISLLWLWCEERGWPQELSRDETTSFLKLSTFQLYLWGEAAVPQLLSHYWFLRKSHAGMAVDALLLLLIRAVTSVSPAGQSVGLPSPYWDFEAIARHSLVPILGRDQDPMSDEGESGSSYFAEPLLHLLVRTNLKQACRELWPAVSRFMLAEFRPRKKWQFCLPEVDEGDNRQVQPPLRKEWSDLVEEARSVRCEVAPKALVDRPDLLALFTILFPYRATPDVVRRLAFVHSRAWLLSDPPIE
jgi:hypothetical protein